MDAWDVDVLLTGAQKALSVPPGLALLAVSERARRRRESLGDVRAYYADLRRWDASVDDPRKYFSTTPCRCCARSRCRSTAYSPKDCRFDTSAIAAWPA